MLGVMHAPGYSEDGVELYSYAHPTFRGPYDLIALSWRMAVAIPIVRIFNVWGALDLLNAYYVGVTQMGDPGLLAAGIYVPALYVPLLLVSHALIFLLLARLRTGRTGGSIWRIVGPRLSPAIWPRSLCPTPRFRAAADAAA
jgi:hypothetical protein